MLLQIVLKLTSEHPFRNWTKEINFRGRVFERQETWNLHPIALVILGVYLGIRSCEMLIGGSSCRQIFPGQHTIFSLLPYFLIVKDHLMSNIKLNLLLCFDSASGFFHSSYVLQGSHLWVVVRCYAKWTVCRKALCCVPVLSPIHRLLPFSPFCTVWAFCLYFTHVISSLNSTTGNG